MWRRLEEEWEDQNRERLMNTVLLANQLVREANMLSEALHKDTLFRVTLTVRAVPNSLTVCNELVRCHRFPSPSSALVLGEEQKRSILAMR